MERLNKEYYLNFNDKINLKYGAVNKKLPQVIYVCGSSWITPKFNGEYHSIINSIFSKFRSQLKCAIVASPYFENKFVCDFDLKTTSLRENKKNYFTFEFYVKQKNNIIQLKDISNSIKNTFQNLIDNFVDNLTDNTFELTKSK